MILFLLFCIICRVSEGLRANLRQKYGDEFIPDYSEFYYYHNLHEKMEELLSINNCSVTGDVTGFEPETGESDFKISIIPPTKQIIKRYGTEGRELYNTSKIFLGTTASLCTSKNFIKFKKGGLLFAKGCLKMYKVDKHGQRIKVINRYDATLHPEHVRCNVKSASEQCVAAAQRPLQLPDEFRSLHSYPFMITVKKVIVSRSGYLALPCGPVGLFGSCESIRYGVPSSKVLLGATQACRDSKSLGTGGKIGGEFCPFRTYERVFVMTQYDDTQIGQFIQEALPKLVYHLNFIKANPDIKIHFGFSKRDTLPDHVLPHHIFHWLGLTDRLVNGTIFANQVFYPREGGCQDVGYNAWEFVTTREKFLELAGVDQDKYGPERSIVVIRRTASEYVANHGDAKQRRWPKESYPILLEQLKKKFPKHRIDIYSDSDKKLMQCRECQIKMFHDADIAIAVHGAGLTNAMFMRPGSVVMEVVAVFDSRHAPIIGIFPRLSGIVGLNHYTYYTEENINNLDPIDLVTQTLAFAYTVGISI